MARNLNKLYLKIIEKYDTCARFADEVKMSTPSLSNKLNGKTKFSTDEAYRICQKLDIPKSKMYEYFLINYL